MSKPITNTKQPTRIQSTNFEKEFEFFNEMINEFKSIHPEMNNIFTYENSEVDEAMVDIINYFCDNRPNIIGRNNLPVALSMTSNKVSLKTNKFFSVRWKFNYDENGFITNLVAGISVFTKGKNTNQDIKNTLEYLKNEENGWKQVEYKQPVNKRYKNSKSNVEQKEEPVEQTENPDSNEAE